MRALVIGLGVQGEKRRRVCRDDYVGSVDPFNEAADYRDISDVPLSKFDIALCCTPNQSKFEIIEYLLSNGKHVLVEKPLWVRKHVHIELLQSLARNNNLICYTAYNHRFEPHFMRMRDVIASGELGRIYSCRMFYGNGTARLVRDSDWRDQGSGVLHDLGSHLLDTAAYWFGSLGDDFRVIANNCFENKAPDHVIVGSESTVPRLELEMTLLSWRNNFTCDIYAEGGSAHIQSLCKWGPATFVQRTRVLPSGQPKEDRDVMRQEDPTWYLEYSHFKSLCENGGKTDLSNDLWINRLLANLGEAAIVNGPDL